MISLTIHHNVRLTREQRLALAAGETVETVGVSVPVWVMNKMTSEPANEVFCRYVLKNPHQDMPIQILDDGYEITVPYREGGTLKISDEEWRLLNANDPRKLDALYKQVIPEVSAKNLLDFDDGGSGGMAYREFNKVEKNDQKWHIMHYVCLDSAEELTPPDTPATSCRSAS